MDSFKSLCCLLLVVSAVTAAPNNYCPPPGIIVNCIRAPCDPRFGASCPKYPNAICRDNYCNECSAKWYLNGRDVTTDCYSRNNNNYNTNYY